MILGEDRYVRLIGISNVGDLLLGLARSSCELPYFWIFIPEYSRVEGIWIKVNIMTAFELNCYGKGEDVGDSRLGLESELIKESGRVWLGFIWMMARLSCVFEKLAL